MRIGLLIILFVGTFNGFSQEYFSERFEFDNPIVADGGSNILEIEDGYIVNGVGGDSLNPSWFRWGLAKFSLSGELLWNKSWGDTIKERYSESKGSLIKHLNNYFALGTMNTYYTEGRHTETVLIKFDENFDTAWTVNYGKLQGPHDSSYYGRNFVGTSDGFVITGALVIDYGETHLPFLLFLDSLGNFKNIIHYPDSNYFFQGNTIIQTADGGFAIGAYKHRVVGGGHKGSAYIFKTDSAGTMEWELDLGGEYRNGTALVCNTNDSTIVAASTYETDSVFINKYRSNTRLTKVDYNGNIIWDYTYTEGQLWSGVSGISNDNNDGYVVCGYRGETVYNVEPNSMAFILKINNQGDSIWYREYAIVEGFLSENTLKYTIPSSDGGYAAIGTCWPIPPDEGTMDAWILKVDSMGCVDFNDCWVGIKENNWTEKEDSSFVEVYPNPAKSRFTIKIVLKDSDNEEFVCSIYDLYGRKVKEINIPGKKLTVISSDWNKGIYLIKISKNGKLFSSKKVLIN